LEKEVTNIIKEEKGKEREENVLRQVKHTHIPMKKHFKGMLRKKIKLGTTMHGRL
jgi:hypothetical protein